MTRQGNDARPLVSEIRNLKIHVHASGRIPWTGYRPVVRAVPVQENVGLYPYPEWESNPGPQYSAVEHTSSTRLTLGGHCDRHYL
jgi:hypothetical protein